VIVDREFKSLIRDTLRGEEVRTRNANVFRTDTLMSTFNSTPLISLRKTAWKNALREWEWFMSGSTNIKNLHPKVHHWWKPWVDEHGDVKNNYSRQFRNAHGICDSGKVVKVDQIEHAIKTAINHKYSRRNIITTWNAAEMCSGETPITNCHSSIIQICIKKDKIAKSNETINITTYQRSVDLMLGLPHNWIQMWAFLHYLAHRTGYEVGQLKWIGGDVHIYEDHLDTAENMLNYDESTIFTPQLIYTPTNDKFNADDFSLKHKYKPVFKHKLKMSV